MASLKDARSLADQLHGLSGRLQSELDKGSVDFERLVELSDEIGESADQLATTFNAINGSLTGLLEGAGGEGKSSDGAEGERAAGAKGGSQTRSRSGGGGGGQRRKKQRDG